MDWLQIIWSGVYGYLFFWSAYLFVFAFAGLFFKNRAKKQSTSNNTYAVIVPSYKEDAIIVKSVLENLTIAFPSNRYQIFVVADSLKKETLAKLEELPIEVIQVMAENSTKAKAVNAALNLINPSFYSHVVVLDADNVMSPNYLQKIDNYLGDEIQALQTHRKAKNVNTTMAVLDAINEEVGNHIFRKGHAALGFSSALIGSGMVFKVEIFKSLMAPIRDTAGEDKMLEFALLEEKIKVEYLDDAIVYDEKVEQKEQFAGQRSRWVAARFYFLKKEAKTSLVKLLKLDFDYFNKWLQFLLPQKILLIANVAFFSVVSVLFSFNTRPSIVLLAMLILAFAMSIPKEFYSVKLLKAVLSIPSMAWSMLKVLLNIKKVDPSKFNVTLKEV